MVFNMKNMFMDLVVLEVFDDSLEHLRRFGELWVFYGC